MFCREIKFLHRMTLSGWETHYSTDPSTDHLKFERSTLNDTITLSTGPPSFTPVYILPINQQDFILFSSQISTQQISAQSMLNPSLMNFERSEKFISLMGERNLGAAKFCRKQTINPTKKKQLRTVIWIAALYSDRNCNNDYIWKGFYLSKKGKNYWVDYV